jgi:hypothetical protein
MTSKLNIAIAITTSCAIIYVVFSQLSVPFVVVFGLLLLSQILLIRMVFIILKAPRQSERTFDEYFYEDADIRPGKEL